MFHIGPPEPPVAVNGSVLQFSPVVIVRLEWQAPFSHSGHHILYYTVYTAQSNETNITDLSHELRIHNGEFSSCKAYVAVSATSDIGESKLSVVTSILKGLYNITVNTAFDFQHVDNITVPRTANFIVDGKIISPSDGSVSVIELQIQVTRVTK